MLLEGIRNDQEKRPNKNDKSTFNVIQSEMGNSRTCQLWNFADETRLDYRHIPHQIWLIYKLCDWEPLQFDVNVNSRVTTLIHTHTNKHTTSTMPHKTDWLDTHFNVAWDSVFTVDWHNNLLHSHFFRSLPPCVLVFAFVYLLSWVLRSTLLNGQIQNLYNKKNDMKKIAAATMAMTTMATVRAYLAQFNIWLWKKIQFKLNLNLKIRKTLDGKWSSKHTSHP